MIYEGIDSTESKIVVILTDWYEVRRCCLWIQTPTGFSESRRSARSLLAIDLSIDSEGRVFFRVSKHFQNQFNQKVLVPGTKQ